MKKIFILASLLVAFATEGNAQFGNLGKRLKEAKEKVTGVKVEDPLLKEMDGKSNNSSESGPTKTQFIKYEKKEGRLCPPRDYKRYEKSSDLEWCRQTLKDAVVPYINNKDYEATWIKVDGTYYMPDCVLAERGLYEYYMDNATNIDAFKDIMLAVFLRKEKMYFNLGNETELMKKGIESEEGSGMLFNMTRWLAEDVIKTACASLSHDDLLGLWRGMINEVDADAANGKMLEAACKCKLQRFIYTEILCCCTQNQFAAEQKNGKMSTYAKMSLEYADYKKIENMVLENALANNPPRKFAAGVAAPAVAAKAVELMKQKFGAKYVKISWITNNWQELKQNGHYSTRKMEFDVLIKDGDEYKSYNTAIWEDYAVIAGRWTGSYHISEPYRNPYKIIYP